VNDTCERDKTPPAEDDRKSTNASLRRNMSLEQYTVVILCAVIIVGLLIFERINAAYLLSSTLILSFATLCVIQSLYQVYLMARRRKRCTSFIPRILITLFSLVQLSCVIVYYEERLIANTAMFFIVLLCGVLNIGLAIWGVRQECYEFIIE